MITQDEINIINSNIKQYLYVIEWLDENENVLDEITVDIVSGNANFDGTKSNRRSINLTLKNLDKKYLPSSQNKLWINKKFRLKCGYKYGDNQKLLYDQGVFLLGNPSILSSPLRKEITIQGLDKWVLFDGTIGGKLKNKTIIPVGTRVDEAIKLLIYNLGGENKYIIDTCDILLPYTIEKEAGTTIADILEEIANIVSYECFYDNYGWFRFRKYLNPTDYNTIPSSWTYTTSGLYLESTRDLNWNEVKNSIKVIGATLNDSTIISAIAQDNSNGDLSISKIGERFELIIDENIFTNQLAQDRANWELQQRIMINENIKATIIPNFSHQVGDIISITDENNGSNGNYVIQTIDFNFGFDSTMNLGLWAIRQWS